jgi:hypothetical protein
MRVAHLALERWVCRLPCPFETLTDVRSMAAFEGDPDISQHRPEDRV